MRSASLQARGIRVVTHLILGLPGENRRNDVRFARACLQTKIFGTQTPHVQPGQGFPDGKDRILNYVSFESIDDYVDLVIPDDRAYPAGDRSTPHLRRCAVRSTLIAPEWSYKKRTILNGIHKKLAEKNTWQGKLYRVPCHVFCVLFFFTVHMRCFQKFRVDRRQSAAVRT